MHRSSGRSALFVTTTATAPHGAASSVLPKRLHEFVVDELGSRIVRGELKPGEALPVEDELANDFGVSRTVVREAIKVLAHKRLLKVRTRTGTRVSPTAEWSQLDQDIKLLKQIANKPTVS